MQKNRVPSLNLNHFNSADALVSRRFCEQVAGALSEFGFFTLNNTTLPPSLVDACYRESSNFFSQPDSWKQQHTPLGAHGQVGYVRFGTERAKDAEAHDLKEFWHVDRASVSACLSENPDNQGYWPVDFPAFAHSLSEMYVTLEKVAQAVLVAAARGCGVDDSTFVSTTMDAPSLLRVAYYPACDPKDHPKSLRAAPHEDINLITLLCASTAYGLEIQPPQGSWLALPIDHPSSIIVSSGDMFQNLTNGLFRSTTHRVVNHNDCREARLSMPFFVHPRPATDLTPMDWCVIKTSGKQDYSSITAGEYLSQRLKEIHLK